MNLFTAVKTFVIMLVLSFSTCFAETAVEAVQNGTNELLSILKKEQANLKKNSGKIFEIAEKVIVPRFDFRVMAQLVMGRPWRQATADQKDAFTKEFKELMINTYANALLDYSDETIKVTEQPRMKDSSAKDLTIKTEIISSKRQPISINFSLHEASGIWLIYDVAIEGVSVVTNYKASIAEEIKQKGIDGMIAEVAKKNTAERNKGVK